MSQCQHLSIATSSPPLTHGGTAEDFARGELVPFRGAPELGQLRGAARRGRGEGVRRGGLGAHSCGGWRRESGQNERRQRRSSA